MCNRYRTALDIEKLRRGVTDNKDVVRLVLDKVDEKNIAILVSDFVFSPGKNANSQDYL